MQTYRNRILIGGVIALALYLIAMLVIDSSGQITAELLGALSAYPWALLLLVMICQVMAGVFRFMEWHYYLGVIGARDRISLLDSAVIFVFGFTMVVSPGKAAELLKSVFLKLKTGVPVARSAPVVLAERVIDGLAVILILTVILLVAGESLALGEFLPMSRTLVFSTALFLGFCLVAVQVRPLADLVLGVIARLPLIRRAHNWFAELYESSREVFRARHVAITVPMGVGVYLSSSAGFVVILSGFGVEITPALVAQAVFIVGVSAAIGALSFVPNGAGVTELSTAAMLLVIVAPANPTLTVGAVAAASLLEGFFHKWFRVIVGLGVGAVFRERLFSAGLDQAIAAARAERRPAPATVESRGA